jgi:hypothetical protein
MVDTPPVRRPRGRPRTTGETAVRSVRIGQVWDEAAAVARTRGETLTAVITRALRAYVKRHGGGSP